MSAQPEAIGVADELRWWDDDVPTGGGWRIVAAKELADHLNSLRFLLLGLGLGLAAVASVVATSGGIRELAPAASGSPAVFLKLFTLGSENLPALVTWIAFLGPLLGIAFGFDAINNERAERTLPRLLSQPIWRDDVINGKFVGALAAIALLLVAIVVVIAGVGIVRLGVVPQPEDLLRLSVWTAVALVYIGFWLALATLFSVLVRRAAASALAALSVWLIASAFAAVLVGVVADALAPLPLAATAAEQIANATLQQDLARLFPGQIFTESTQAILDPSVRATGLVLASQADRAVPSTLSFDQSLLVVWPQLVVLVALTVACFVLAYVAFMRQEVRA
jgi:ABC-2 type transport system permease protein